MKLEYLAAGSEDCPLIRLFHFDVVEARQLSHIFHELADGTRSECELHSEPMIESISGCRLTLRAGGRDRGITQNTPLNFTCEFTVIGEGWLEMAEKVESLYATGILTGHQWLNGDWNIAFLLSPSGQW
jgi:hypothetical protein